MKRDARELGREVSWITLGLALVGFATAGPAHADCAAVPLPAKPDGQGRLLSTVYLPGETAGVLMPISSSTPPIVGLWKFEQLAENTSTNTNPMPNGTVVDFGTVAWHADGTELMNSGSRPPSTGNFCQGVWTQTGPSTYKLHHVALGWTATAYTGPSIIDEEVTINNSGMNYSGNFTISVYSASEEQGQQFDTSTLVATITGKVNASKITVD